MSPLRDELRELEKAHQWENSVRGGRVDQLEKISPQRHDPNFEGEGKHIRLMFAGFKL